MGSGRTVMPNSTQQSVFGGPASVVNNSLFCISECMEETDGQDDYYFSDCSDP